MSNNTLIAFSVGAIFLLAVVVVVGSLADRRHSRQMLTLLIQNMGMAYSRAGGQLNENTEVIPEPTETKWPAVAPKS